LAVSRAFLIFKPKSAKLRAASQSDYGLSGEVLAEVVFRLRKSAKLGSILFALFFVL